MTDYKKTVVKLAVSENCRKLLYISEPSDPIFKVYGSGIFCLFFAKPTRMVSTVRGNGQVSLCMRGA
jgi:hypothetical protein